MVLVLLRLSVGRCTNDQLFETKTVHVGEEVELLCPRERESTQAFLYWFRLVSGRSPHFIGGTFSFNYDGVKQIPRITAKQGNGTFLLHIKETDLNDTGFYYCLKANRLNLTFLKGIILTVKGPEPKIITIIEEPIPGPVRPGDSVTLQCSVLSDSDSGTCPRAQGVHWFRPGSDGSQARLIFTEGGSGGECERRLEIQRPQKCVYNFSKTISSSDAGTYHCAVATCGQILFGNGTKLDIDVVSSCDSHRDNTVLFLLCVALATSLIVIISLVCVVINTSTHCCKATSCNEHSHEKRNEDTLVYSTVRTTGGNRRKAAVTEEAVYTNVGAFQLQ
ncbi:uncharacterized protein LOC121202562 [Betta splendens]|uniref:Uncharacterized protein LOC121202562 n=1 Tax=Betta splendens TaxID=158456 RepID=A0A9W2Y3Q4_BETSP|nr:uncharacterized protein LOC121202562 [Betta splendens]